MHESIGQIKVVLEACYLIEEHTVEESGTGFEFIIKMKCLPIIDSDAASAFMQLNQRIRSLTPKNYLSKVTLKTKL